MAFLILQKLALPSADTNKSQAEIFLIYKTNCLLHSSKQSAPRSADKLPNKFFHRKYSLC
jgi:hypothetical protein